MRNKGILNFNVTFSILLSPSEMSITGKDFFPSLKMFLKSPSGRHYLGNQLLEQRKVKDGNVNLTLIVSATAHQSVFLI